MRAGEISQSVKGGNQVMKYQRNQEAVKGHVSHLALHDAVSVGGVHIGGRVHHGQGDPETSCREDETQ